MSLFGELIPRLSAHPENAASDALEYLFRTSAPSRRAVASLLVRHGVSPVGDLRFVREATGEDGERPDLAIFDASGGEVALVEVKFWAGFTANQPLSYLSRIRGEKPAALIFIVPDSRVPWTWRHVSGTIHDAGMDVMERSGDPPSLRTGATDSVSLVVIGWRVMLADIQDHLSVLTDTQALADVGQLRGLIDRMDTEQFLPVHPQELSTGIARRQMQLADLLLGLFENLEERGICVRPRSLRASNTWGLALGANVYIREVGFWIGLYYGPWRDLDDTPFWMQLLDEDASNPDTVSDLQPLTLRSPVGLFQHNGNWLLPLRLQTGVERDQELSHLASQVREISELLGVTQTIDPAERRSRARGDRSLQAPL